jgi:hypothetical protein
MMLIGLKFIFMADYQGDQRIVLFLSFVGYL